MIATLANILIRQANKTENPNAFLDSLITSTLNDLSGQGGAITSVTVNGKSTQLQLPSGTGPRDLMVAAQLALSMLESGIGKVPRQTMTVFR